jgi:dTDP-L-rhamnose 4-epimerase
MRPGYFGSNSFCITVCAGQSRLAIARTRTGHRPLKSVNTRRVLITGGAGFIGSHTADALAKRGYAVRILDNLQDEVHRGKWPAYVKGKGYELIRGDVRERTDWLRALREVQYVYHLAAYQDQRPDFAKFFHTNTVSAALLYELAVERNLPIKRIVLASTQFVYGDGIARCRHSRAAFRPEPRTIAALEAGRYDVLCPHGATATFSPFKEDQPLTPTNSYGLSKEAIERLALRLGRTYRIPSTIVRYSIVQGPRQSPLNLYSGALRIFVTQALAGKPITVYEDGRQKRDFVNVADVVAANLRVLTRPEAAFEIFNVGGGHAYTVMSFARAVKRITGSASKIVVGGHRPTDTRHAVSDTTKLRKLGWKPRYTIEDSIRDYVAWYRRHF